MFHYFLEVSLAWMLLLIVYYVFLRKETFFKTNRWYLMHSLLLGLILPLIRKIPLQVSENLSQSAPVELINLGTYNFSRVIDDSQSLGIEWDFQTVLLTIYALGVVLLSFRMLYGLMKIFRIWNSSQKIKKGDYTLVVTNVNQLPFSFLKMYLYRKHF